MKMYSVKKGTTSIVLDASGKKAMNFTTTKDLDFFDTVTDPIRFRNQRKPATNHFEELARVGYAVFRAEDRDLYLAVDYDSVEVMA